MLILKLMKFFLLFPPYQIDIRFLFECTSVKFGKNTHYHIWQHMAYLFSAFISKRHIYINRW